MGAADYQVSLRGLENESKAEALKQVHHRSATRLKDLCFQNGGIYIKLGQHLAQLVPPPKLRQIPARRRSPSVVVWNWMSGGDRGNRQQHPAFVKFLTVGFECVCVMVVASRLMQQPPPPRWVWLVYVLNRKMCDCIKEGICRENLIYEGKVVTALRGRSLRIHAHRMALCYPPPIPAPSVSHTNRCTCKGRAQNRNALEICQCTGTMQHRRWLLLSNELSLRKSGCYEQEHLLPEEYVEVMRQHMLDKCPASPWPEVERTLTRELGSPPSVLFAAIDVEPLASASLAQVLQFSAEPVTCSNLQGTVCRVRYIV